MPKPVKAFQNIVKHANPLPLLRPRRKVTVGGVPGLTPEQIAEKLKDNRAKSEISIIDYGGGRTERQDHVTDLPAQLDEGRPDWASVRWINVVGLQDPQTLSTLAKHYDLHPLAMEDVVHASSRPKVETYGEPEIGRPRYFLAARMLYRDEQTQGLVSEQISLFVGPHTVITFQQLPGDVWEPVRQRITNAKSRFQERGPGYLLYALLDAVVDALFPLLDEYAERIDLIEDQILNDTAENTIITDVHRLKRELMLLRREAWPLRELVRSVLEHDNVLMEEQTRVFLRDVGDHAVSAIELLETYRELAHGLAEAWMSSVSNRMNEVMKVLTIIASLFIPISFLAGVFGMNFDRIPGLHHPAAFVFFCCACIGICVGMLIWFRRRGWL
ncbi:MAG: magnesium/cobalt transporter CorA [Phycisphaeraceae bacterium]